MVKPNLILKFMLLWEDEAHCLSFPKTPAVPEHPRSRENPIPSSVFLATCRSTARLLKDIISGLGDQREKQSNYSQSVNLLVWL